MGRGYVLVYAPRDRAEVAVVWRSSARPWPSPGALTTRRTAGVCRPRTERPRCAEHWPRTCCPFRELSWTERLEGKKYYCPCCATRLHGYIQYVGPEIQYILRRV